ncbi:MAG: hypothetical protein AAGF12_01255 [Myxococcota bacterium]
MTRLIILAFVFTVLGAATVAAAQPRPPAPSDFETLARATSFEPGGTTISNRRSTFLEALDRLARAPNAEQQLTRLFTDRRTTTEGRLYALIGLRHLSEGTYRTLAARIRPNLRVRARLGCVGLEIGAEEALRRIDEGEAWFPADP